MLFSADLEITCLKACDADCIMLQNNRLSNRVIHTSNKIGLAQPGLVRFAMKNTLISLRDCLKNWGKLT